MARKNPFENLLNEPQSEEEAPKTNYAAKGASRSIMNTIDDLTEKADKLLEGETIVELDPKLVDPSFLKDRLGQDDQEFQDLLRAIDEEGQSTPILVRPHPTVQGRYMVVFGARRRKVAEVLGIPVRAVVKQMSDRNHAVAQGQENAARANLSFIERAKLASRVVQENYDSDNSTVLSALSIDKATLSKMLSVSKIPDEILDAIGAAKTVGRDRWYELKTLLDKPANLVKAIDVISVDDFDEGESEQRFDKLLTALKRGKKTSKSLTHKSRKWVPKDKQVSVDLAPRGKTFSIAVKASDNSALKFGEYIAENLEVFYEDFKKTTK